MGAQPREREMSILDAILKLAEDIDQELWGPEGSQEINARGRIVPLISAFADKQRLEEAELWKENTPDYPNVLLSAESTLASWKWQRITELKKLTDADAPDWERAKATGCADAALIAAGYKYGPVAVPPGGAVTSIEETLQDIAGFAVGHGDVCEIIARRARAALAKYRADGASRDLITGDILLESIRRIAIYASRSTEKEISGAAKIILKELTGLEDLDKELL
jgi:hypothetical protein